MLESCLSADEQKKKKLKMQVKFRNMFRMDVVSQNAFRLRLTCAVSLTNFNKSLSVSAGRDETSAIRLRVYSPALNSHSNGGQIWRREQGHITGSVTL